MILYALNTFRKTHRNGGATAENPLRWVLTTYSKRNAQLHVLAIEHGPVVDTNPHRIQRREYAPYILKRLARIRKYRKSMNPSNMSESRARSCNSRFCIILI